MKSLNYCTLLLALFIVGACDSGVSEPKEPTVINNRPIPKSNGSNTVVINTKPPSSPIDQSPMDMLYYPLEYAKLKSQGKAEENPYVRVIYSRPHRHGRKIFGDLQKYGFPWRLGANEATEIEFFRSATINGNKINKGRYIIYCIPEKDKWTIAINSNIYTWGLQFDQSKDVLRTEIPVEQVSDPTETFTMSFEGSGNETNLVMEWDDVKARLPIVF
jgi:hypothetical protein